MMMMNGIGSYGLLSSLVMLITLAVLVLAGVWLYRQLTTPHPNPTALEHTTGVQALTRLRERYAAGDIDDEEYERRLSALSYWH